LTLGSALSLDAGEMEALSIMARAPQALFLTDDAAARLAAHQLGYRVHGSIGILLRAIRRRQLTATEVLVRLRAIPQRSSLYVRPALLEEIVTRVQQEHGIDFSAQS
jgi:predicted nucleic acid-binding protein